MPGSDHVATRCGQLRVDLPNNHLQYAFTWFGLAACLIGVFSVYAWRRLHEPDRTLTALRIIVHAMAALRSRASFMDPVIEKSNVFL